MKKFGTFALCGLALCFISASPADAQRHRYVENVYEGLLPADMQPAPAPLDAAELAESRVAVIPSVNFETHARVWQEQYEQAVAGQSSTWRGEAGLASLESNNPQHFSDQVLTTLQPYVGEVFATGDLVQARANGATYYVIIDYFMRGGALNLRPVGGVRVLNASLEEVIAISHAPTVQWVRSGPAHEAYQQSMARVFQAVVEPTLSDLRAALAASTVY
jgi:hypothetical protein